jgi:hypothetical protein
MLKITQHSRYPGRRVIRLEGRLVGPWVAELRQVVGGVDAGSIRIDLAGLAFADADGVTLLRNLQEAGAELVEASGFLAALIGGDDGEDREVG